MTVEILLALVASLFTATASVAQRIAAAPAPGELSFSWRLVTFLLKRPIWFLGLVCMIGGFLFQVAALKIGNLSLVQPVIATELLFVFAFLAIRGRRMVRARDWLAAFGMAAGLGAFLTLASPRGADSPASGWTWIVAGASIVAAVVITAGLAVVRFRQGQPPSAARKAAMLAISAGIAWGFVASVVKEFSTHLHQGPVGIFTTWPLYVLALSAFAAIFLVSNAFQAGPLAASQPGLTIVDPLVASLLGVTIFDEHIRHSAPYLAGETAAFVVMAVSVILLASSPLIHHEPETGARPPDDRATSERASALSTTPGG